METKMGAKDSVVGRRDLEWLKSCEATDFPRETYTQTHTR